jgi:hypothetical protein
MSGKKIGIGIILLGALIVTLSILVDTLGFGKQGIQAAQLLGVNVGLFTILCGIGFLGVELVDLTKLNSIANTTIDKLKSASPAIWVVVGFLLSYLLFFTSYTFLNSRLTMQYFNRFLPTDTRIGLDIRILTKVIESWLLFGDSPYQGGVHYYPPFANLFFAPLVLFKFPTSYNFITVITTASFLILSLLIPLLVSQKKNYSLLMLFTFTGLLSYGLQFELERGQFNIITFLFCLSAIYIFHTHYNLRYVAYILFSISVQLKIYPAIFILLFIKNWKDWKNNLTRFIGLGLFNVLLLFCLGYQIFLDFYRSVTSHLSLESSWIGNHSIKAFVYNLSISGFGVLSKDSMEFVQYYSREIELILLVFYGICLLAVIWNLYNHNEKNPSFYLLLICTIGSMIIPSYSQDYTLPILVTPMLLALSSTEITSKGWRKILATFLVVLSSAAYSSLLFPFKAKPDYLSNGFPALFTILISMTALYFVKGNEIDELADT